ncbi:hypothetical protein LuPra_03767 [Luteitalea pratensis]|uniref:Uncharacterized protein n=1 Tax=Luteitalea pratensis TaxID=1855912 RepID=A0A143PQ27_LUTPR|nr:hypothetical protein LuPra_03767 [Luteitalea pratensis]
MNRRRQREPEPKQDCAKRKLLHPVCFNGSPFQPSGNGGLSSCTAFIAVSG